MRSVCISGSGRFKKEVKAFADGLRKLGVVVFAPYHHSGQADWEKKGLEAAHQEFIALGLTHDHCLKIRMADVVYVYNKNGYVGPSTTLEMGYALALGKPIYALTNKDEELCRRVLIRGTAKTPKELLRFLR